MAAFFFGFVFADIPKTMLVVENATADILEFKTPLVATCLQVKLYIRMNHEGLGGF